MITWSCVGTQSIIMWLVEVKKKVFFKQKFMKNVIDSSLSKTPLSELHGAGARKMDHANAKIAQWPNMHIQQSAMQDV